MKSVSGRHLAKILENQGWNLRRIKGSHHIYSKAKKVVSVPIHGKKDLRKGTQIAIMKQAGITDDML
ncbi:MAG: type II toxin-antitoxin system HicA family toxin [Balneolaceae bacterium]|nr:MAG: type II toxin-antitoxin system HicA family toxin [Balneolaceae bacterium]